MKELIDERIAHWKNFIKQVESNDTSSITEEDLDEMYMARTIIYELELIKNTRQMKPYGIDKKLRINLPDIHPKKGFVNWWENEFKTFCKKRARRKAKEEIKALDK